MEKRWLKIATKKKGRTQAQSDVWMTATQDKDVEVTCFDLTDGRSESKDSRTELQTIQKARQKVGKKRN